MVRKRIGSALIGVGFITTMMSTPTLAADISISGEVDMHFYQYSSTSSTAGLDLESGTAGSNKSYNHMYTAFDETELKFKTKGETSNGWKTSAEVEMEIGQGGKNDFELEEASASIDFGSVKLTGGILEDWGTESGTSCALVESWDPTVSSSDESAAIRVAIKAVENLKLDVKLLYTPSTVDHDSSADTSEVNVSQNETRLQGKYNFGMGYAQVIYASLANSIINSDDGASYSYTETMTDFLIGLKFGLVSPWVEMTSINENETVYTDATLAATAKTELSKTQNIIGADVRFNEALTLTTIYMTQTVKIKGISKNAEKTDMNLGIAYSVKPVVFRAVYFTSSNNYSTVNSGQKDGSISGFDLSMQYKF